MMHIPEQILFFRSGLLTQLALLVGFLIAVPGHSQNVKINLSIQGVTSDTLYLGYPLGGPSVLKHADTLVLRKGKGVFRAKELYPAGLYGFIIDGKKYDFLMPKSDQQFEMAFDTAQFLKSVRVKGSIENQELYSYMRFMTHKRESLSSLEGALRLAPQPKADSIARLMEGVHAEVNAYRDRMIQIHEKNLFGKFLKAYSEIVIPLPPVNTDEQPADSFYAYRYYREHFFDNADYADPDLVRMPLMEEKISTYVTSVLPMIPDTVIAEADRMLTRAQPHNENFRVVLTTLFDYYLQSNRVAAENVWVHLAEKWFFPYADWATPEYTAALKEEVELRKKSLIGEVAAPFDVFALPAEYFRAAASDTTLLNDTYAGKIISALSQLNGKVNLLYFWEAECGHCQVFTPELYALFKKYKEQGLKVVTVQTNNSNRGKRSWIDFVNQNGLYDWPLTWSPQSYQYKLDYHLLSTPQLYFIEASTGRILLKNIPIEQVEEIIQMIIKP